MNGTFLGNHGFSQNVRFRQKYVELPAAKVFGKGLDHFEAPQNILRPFRDP